MEPNKDADNSVTAGSENFCGIRVLLVDDHPIVRMGLSALLNLQEDIRVIGMESSGSCAISRTDWEVIDVILLDLRLPGLSGIETLKRIREVAPGARSIILSSFELDEEIHAAIKAGAQGYVHKEAPGEEILRAIREVYRGKQAFPKRIANRIANGDLTSGLSARELEVLELVAKGLTNKEVARVLSISQYTVRNHLSSVCMKLDVRDRTEAIVVAIQAGVITMT